MGKKNFRDPARVVDHVCRKAFQSIMKSFSPTHTAAYSCTVRDRACRRCNAGCKSPFNRCSTKKRHGQCIITRRKSAPTTWLLQRRQQQNLKVLDGRLSTSERICSSPARRRRSTIDRANTSCHLHRWCSSATVHGVLCHGCKHAGIAGSVRQWIVQTCKCKHSILI